MQSIVITGGPCSGKTSAIKVLRERLAAADIPALFVEEAGTDLILQGVTPQSCGCMRLFQLEVAKLQLEREAAARAEAEKAGLAAETLVVCDRGIADGAAYLSPEEYAWVLQSIGLSAQDALLRYDAAFCLESTAKIPTEGCAPATSYAAETGSDGANAGDSNSGEAPTSATHPYTLANNTARHESREEAAALDDRTYAAWETHPHFYFIPNAASFEEKVNKLLDALMSFAR